MKRRNWYRVLAMLLCMVMILSNLGFFALAEFTEPIPCAHSNYTVTTEAGEAATCTQAGWHTVVTACTDCGEVLSREQVTDAALGHDYQESFRTEATCTESGSVTYTCTRCGDSYTEALEAGHHYVSVVTDPTCTQNGYTTWTCSVCGDSYVEAGAEALDHDYQESERVEATVEADGSVTWTCSRCGDSYTEVLPKLETESAQGAESQPSLTFTVSKVPHTVTIADIAHGTLIPDPEKAVEGETVTLTVDPDDGYTLKEGTIAITDREGQPVNVNIGNNTCTFIMPASEVTATAEFEALEQELRLYLFNSDSRYGDFIVSVNDVEKATASTIGDNSVVAGVKTDDKITVTFFPADDGYIMDFHVTEYDPYRETNHTKDIENNVYTFPMPAGRVDISVHFEYRNTTEMVSYVDEFGEDKTVEAFVLTGDEYIEYYDDSYRVVIGEEIDDGSFDPTPVVNTWYVVKGDISYFSEQDTNLQLKGHVHLIIADGVTLRVQSAVKDGTLSVYGQTSGTGRLVTDSFYGGDLNICSAAYETGSVRSSSFVNVKNGSLTVNGNVHCSDLNISGGVTNIAGTAEADSGDFILGCSDVDDRITVGAYNTEHSAYFMIKDGQTLTDGFKNYKGVLGDDVVRTLGGRTLKLFHVHDDSNLTHYDAVTPTYDPETGKYTEGSKEYYICSVCGSYMTYNSATEEYEDVDPDTLAIRYFTFREMPSVSGVLWSYNGADADVYIPATVPADLDPDLAGKTITSINSDAFKGNTGITSITFGCGADVGISENAFVGCTNLNTVYGPHSSSIYAAAAASNIDFIPINRHAEPTWTWAEDYSSATATFSNCDSGTCALNGKEIVDNEISVSEDGTSYVAEVKVDGETYTDEKPIDSYWQAIQFQINAAAGNTQTTIVLARECKAGPDETALIIPENANITIDLKGNALNRNLDESQSDGCVIINNGTLTIKDSLGQGLITGGWNTGNGGGIDNYGDLTMDGGIISGNRADEGGGVFLREDSSFQMSHGDITGNRATKGGGVFVSDENCVFTLDGGSIKGNTVSMYGGGVMVESDSFILLDDGEIWGNVVCPDYQVGEGNPVGEANNICLDGVKIKVNGSLKNRTPLGITMINSGNPDILSSFVFTSGADFENVQAAQAVFRSDDSTYTVGLNADGEAYLGVPVTVTFNRGDDSAAGTMEGMEIATDSQFILPACDYLPPASKTFKEWSVTIGNADAINMQPNTEISVTADTTVTAVWEEMTEPAFNGHAVLLTGQIGLQFFLDLPEGKTPADYTDGYVTFEGNKVDSSVHYPLPGSTAKIGGTDTGRYLFAVNLSSIQMADKITPTFHYTEDGSEKAVAGAAYAVEDYIKWALGATSGKDLAIVQALADYGYYAQPYLSAQNGWTVGRDYAEMTTRVTPLYIHDTVAAALAAYEIVKGTNDRITKVTYQMQFGSEIALRIFLTPAAGVTLSTVRVDGADVTPVKSGDRYYVTISGIKATELTKSHTIEAEGATTTVSPMSYVYSILTSPTTGNEAKNLVCALYNYAQACG